MNKNLFKLVWFVFPLTKIVYLYIGLSSGVEPTTNGVQGISVLFLLLGICLSIISIYFAQKLNKNSNVTDNKMISTVYKRVINQFSEKDKNLVVLFNVFTVLIGLGETAAMFGLVQYMITGNLVIFLILIGLCIITWINNYPKYVNFNED